MHQIPLDKLQETLEERSLALLGAIKEATDISYPLWLDPRDYGIGDQYGFPAGGPPGAPLVWIDRRKKGEFIPVFLTEWQVLWIRRRVRSVCAQSEIALNIIANHVNYVVGKGLLFKVQPKTPSTPPSIVAAAQQVIDAFSEFNNLPQRQLEALTRLMIDGEVFQRLFDVGDGMLALRFVEPEHVRSPNGTTDPRDSFGIRTSPLDVETIEGYWIVEGIPEETGYRVSLVPPGEVSHQKWHETPLSSKRGLTPFYPIETNLRMAEDLLISTTSLAKARAKIAMVRKLSGAVSDVAQALVAAQSSQTVTDPQTNEAINIERYRYGTTLTIPETASLEFPSANVSAADHVAVFQMVLRSIGLRFCMPEYLISSDASNANYASTMVSESPFVKAMERLQEQQGKAWAVNRFGDAQRSILWRQLLHAAKQGILPRDILGLVDIQAEGPSLTVRDVAKEAQVDKIYHEIGVKSKTTIQMQQGLDPDEEEANIAKEQPKQQPLGPQPPLPGAGNPSPAPPRPVREGPDFDEDKHPRADDGKFGSGGGNSANKSEPDSKNSIGVSPSPKAAKKTKVGPSKREERDPAAVPKAKKWRNPPPKVPRAEGEVFTRPKGEESQTVLGDLTEELARRLGFRNILPPGKRSHSAGENEEKGSTIDVEFDHSGRAYEIKMCKTTSQEYRLKAKAKEKEQKAKYAELNDLIPYTMIAVRDEEGGKTHFYAAKEPGLISANVSEEKFDYVGTVAHPKG